MNGDTRGQVGPAAELFVVFRPPHIFFSSFDGQKCIEEARRLKDEWPELEFFAGTVSEYGQACIDAGKNGTID